MVLKDLWLDNYQWNFELIKSIFSDPRDVVAILKIYIPHNRNQDIIIWAHTKHGNLTTKSAYKIICEGNKGIDLSMKHIKWMNLWKLRLPLRIVLFGWKCLRKAIPVRNLLFSKFNIGNDICLICGKEKESIFHGPFLCEYARFVWFGSNSGLIFVGDNNIQILDWRKNIINPINHTNSLVCSSSLGSLFYGGPFGKRGIITFLGFLLLTQNKS